MFAVFIDFSSNFSSRDVSSLVGFYRRGLCDLVLYIEKCFFIGFNLLYIHTKYSFFLVFRVVFGMF